MLHACQQKYFLKIFSRDREFEKISYLKNRKGVSSMPTKKKTTKKVAKKKVVAKKKPATKKKATKKKATPKKKATKKK